MDGIVIFFYPKIQKEIREISFNHVERDTLEKRLEEIKVAYFSRFIKKGYRVLDIGCRDGHISQC